MKDTKERSNIFSPKRWGLEDELIDTLEERLHRCWERFRSAFRTQTRDTSENAKVYMKGQMELDTKRNYANIARRVNGSGDDGQSLQHFMSDSPWEYGEVFDLIQEEIKQTPALSGGMLTLDESGNERSGTKSAGVSRQYLGRMGKVELGQVGVLLGYTKESYWTMVDAELHLPQEWFSAEYEELRHRGHFPEDAAFQTKQEQGLRLIRLARQNGFPFGAVGCDTLYGRDSKFRAGLEKSGETYMADIPCNLKVYTTKPRVGIPLTPSGKRGPSFKKPRVLGKKKPSKVKNLAKYGKNTWETASIRQTERGLLSYECTARRVWTLTEKLEVREEWLFIRKEEDGSFSFSLSNAPADCPLEQLAKWRCLRYFTERVHQDSKSELGWDELEAGKYRAWCHHVALTALTLWFLTQTKLEWALSHPRDPSLLEQLEVEQLPALSIANLCELLKAVMPLEQFTPQQARGLVIQHLVNRSHSTASRLRAQGQMGDP